MEALSKLEARVSETSIPDQRLVPINTLHGSDLLVQGPEYRALNLSPSPASSFSFFFFYYLGAAQFLVVLTIGFVLVSGRVPR